MKNIKPLFLMFLLLNFHPACGAGFESASGQDALRGGSVQSVLDQYIDDRVSAPEGDNSDWRVVELEQPSSVTVEIWWDNPQVDGNLLIRGRKAATIRELEHVAGRRHEKLGPLELPEGKWYIRVQATSGSSGYTMRIATENSSGGALPEF